MRKLSLCLLIALSVLTLCKAQSEQTVNDLLWNIRAALPKGWIASYDAKNPWLEITRSEPTLLESSLANPPPDQKPELWPFTFAFRVGSEMTPARYSSLKEENTEVRNQMDVLYKDLVNRGVPHPGVSPDSDHFEARTERDRSDVQKYKNPKASLHPLPNLYYRDISLTSDVQPEGFPVDDRIRQECEEVKKRVFSLLSRYEVETEK